MLLRICHSLCNVSFARVIQLCIFSKIFFLYKFLFLDFLFFVPIFNWDFIGFVLNKFKFPLDILFHWIFYQGIWYRFFHFFLYYLYLKIFFYFFHFLLFHFIQIMILFPIFLINCIFFTNKIGINLFFMPILFVNKWKRFTLDKFFVFNYFYLFYL